MDMLDAIQNRKHSAQLHKSVSKQKLRTRVKKLEKNLLPTPEKKIVHGTIWTAPSIVTDAISKKMFRQIRRT